MKKLFFLLVLVTSAMLWAESKVTNAGIGTVRHALVTWTVGANTGKTHGILLGNSVYIDTSSTGQANQFKRSDNTADSCSPWFFIASDSLGGTRPILGLRAWGKFRSVDKDSGGFVFRIQTREVRFVKNRTINWTQATRSGSNGSDPDETITDSLVIPTQGSVEWISQYARAKVEGIQARLCPDDLPATANAATDTVHWDSLEVWAR